jgi:hypothetical protein
MRGPLKKIPLQQRLPEANLSRLPTNGVFYKHVSRADTCHIVGTVQLHKYSPPTVGKCDKSQSYFQCRANALQRMMRSHV